MASHALKGQKLLALSGRMGLNNDGSINIMLNNESSINI